MLKSILLACCVLVALSGTYYYWLYPPSVYKHGAQKMLDDLGKAVETQNAADVKQTLGAMLAENARIELMVGPPAASASQAGAEKESFSKSDFLSFIDNTLYSLRDYHFTAAAQSMALNADRTAGSLAFSATTAAGGIAESPEESAIRFTSRSQCTAELHYAPGAAPLIQHLSCTVALHYAAADHTAGQGR